MILVLLRLPVEAIGVDLWRFTFLAVRSILCIILTVACPLDSSIFIAISSSFSFTAYFELSSAFNVPHVSSETVVMLIWSVHESGRLELSVLRREEMALERRWVVVELELIESALEPWVPSKWIRREEGLLV